MEGLGQGLSAAFFPSSVIKGLLAAIGIILILKQIPHLFGHDPDWMGDMSFMQPDGENTFASSSPLVLISTLGPRLWVCSLSCCLFFGTKHPLSASPCRLRLVVVLLGIGAVMLLEPGAEVWSIGSNHLVQVPVSDGLGGLFQSALSGLLKDVEYRGASRSSDHCHCGNPRDTTQSGSCR